MNKTILIFAVLMISGFAMATLLSNPYLSARYGTVMCQGTYFTSLRSAVNTYNSSLNSTMDGYFSSLLLSAGNITHSCDNVDAASFNSEYNGRFMPLINQATVTYFRAAFNNMPPSTWATVFTQFGTFQSSLQTCLGSADLHCPVGDS